MHATSLVPRTLHAPGDATSTGEKHAALGSCPARQWLLLLILPLILLCLDWGLRHPPPAHAPPPPRGPPPLVS